jgi:hypothetical protein
MTNGRNVRRWLAAGLLMVFGLGCRGFQTDLLPLPLALDCADIDFDTARATSLEGRNASAKDLQCSLESIRQRLLQGVTESVVAARLAYLIADRTGNETRRERLAYEGMRWAKHAVDLSADLYKGQGAPAHYYLAVNLGLAVQDTVILALKNIDGIRKHLEIAGRKDPDLDNAGPLRVLGLLYIKVPSWPKGWGDMDKGLELLAEAVRRFPDYPPNRILYARGLANVDAESNKAEIKGQLDALGKLLAVGDWGQDLEVWRKQAAGIARDVGL